MKYTKLIALLMVVMLAGNAYATFGKILKMKMGLISSLVPRVEIVKVIHVPSAHYGGGGYHHGGYRRSYNGHYGGGGYNHYGYKPHYGGGNRGGISGSYETGKGSHYGGYHTYGGGSYHKGYGCNC